MQARRRRVLCVTAALAVLTAADARAQQGIPPMKARVLVGAAGEFDADLQYYDPSDLFLRVKDAQVLPFWVSAKNASPQPALISPRAFTLRVGNGKAVTPLAAMDASAAEDALKKATSLNPLLRILAAQGCEYCPDPLRRAFREETVRPGETVSGWIYFPRPAGLDFNGFMEFVSTGHRPSLLPTASVAISGPPEGTRAGPRLPAAVVRAINAATKIGEEIRYGSPPFERSVAVLFGISEYDRRNDTWAHRDLENMSKALTAQGFDPVIKVANRDVTADTLRNIQGHFKNDLRPDDRLLVYYSGHGERSPKGDTGYIVLAASNPGASSRKTDVSMTEFMSWMRNLPVKHLLVILDACYSGLAIGDRSKGQGPVLDALTRQQLYELSSRSGRFVITAGDDAQLAHEHNRWDGGLFTRGLLQALATRDGSRRPDNRLVTAWELFVRAKEYVREQVRTYRLSPQAPLFRDLGEAPSPDPPRVVSRGEFVFVNMP
ncbi:MAG TPA: caspase family protein [Vicinamibacterales bacterium]|nr:caspase family protein [Vicinamibacterales bacterium]